MEKGREKGRCWEGMEMLVLGGLPCQVVLVVPLGCPPAPATAVGAKTLGGKRVSASCDITPWFC